MGARLVARRYAWVIVVIVAVLPILWRASSLRGLYRPILVSSESMSPTLWGPSLCTQCSGCGIPLRFVARPSDHSTAICFNCGQSRQVANLSVRASDRVLIDSAAYLCRPPQRFDLVAIQSPNAPITVKRVLAGPGESVIFDRGDLFVDRELTSRGIDDVLANAIDVCDDRYRNRNRSRWFAGEPSGWEKQARSFRYTGAAGQRGEPLNYAHQLVHRSNQPHRVMDDYPQNHHLSRQMNTVDDLIVRFRCSPPPGTQIHVAIFALEQWHECRFDRSQGHWAITGADNRSMRISSTKRADSKQIIVAYLDGWFWAGVEGDMRRIESVARESRDISLDTLQPIAIACTPAGNQSTAIYDLRVQRDLHWFMPATETDSHIVLGDQRYFVVGDNPPASLDSRHDRDGVPRDSIIGRAILYR